MRLLRTFAVGAALATLLHVLYAEGGARSPSAAFVEPSFVISGFETDVPVVAISVHSGHALRPEVAAALALSEEARLREEDPHTERLAEVVEARVVVNVSRFEVDLNRPPARAVYRSPEEAWELRVFADPPREELLRRSLRLHELFYASLRRSLSSLEARFGRFVVLDLHSYNHRRRGPIGPPDDPRSSPDLNVGTGTMSVRFEPLVRDFMRDFALASGKDVRENVRFRGGYLPTWVHETFPDRACTLALEFKKTFMDEWSGEVFEAELLQLRDALGSTVPTIVSALERVK